MPWHIAKRGSQYCVIKDSDGSNEGCHATKQEAQDHMAALYANESVIPLQTQGGRPMRTWSSPNGIAFEGIQTGDGRIFTLDAFSWQDLPLPLLPEHLIDDAIGNVQAITRAAVQPDVAALTATGVIDDLTERGMEMCRQMDEGTAPLGNAWGVSVEPDDWNLEVVDTGAVIGGDPEELIDMQDKEDAGLLASCPVVARFHGSGPLPTRHELHAIMQGVTAALTAAAGDGDPSGVVVYEDKAGALVARFTAVRIRALATVTVPAFDQAFITLDPIGEPVPATPMMPEPAVVAAFSAASTIRFPRAAFEQPEPDIVSALTVNDDGTWYGHVHAEGQCHIGYPGTCRTGPPSPTAYEFFNRTGGVVDLDDGTSLRCAPFMFDCNHAPLAMAAHKVLDHYAHTGAIFGFGRVREGEHGPFACGVLNPRLTAEELTMLKACGQVSGDWRNNELYACQAVPRPGFPIVRASGHDHEPGHVCGECESATTAMLTAIYEELIAKPRRREKASALRASLGK